MAGVAGLEPAIPDFGVRQHLSLLMFDSFQLYRLDACRICEIVPTRVASHATAGIEYLSPAHSDSVPWWEADCFQGYLAKGRRPNATSQVRAPMRIPVLATAFITLAST